jgi:hypothetical protein
MTVLMAVSWLFSTFFFTSILGTVSTAPLLLWLFFTRAYFFAQLTFGFLTHQQR